MTDPVTIVFHLGAPKPNMDVLTSSLRKDNDLMKQHGTMARRPRLYRSALQTRLMELEIEGATVEDTEQFLSKLCQQQDLNRLLLSDGNFLSPAEKIFSNDGFFASASDHVQRLLALFPDNPCEFFLEIRDPRLLRADVLAVLGQDDTPNDTDDTHPLWSTVINDIRQAAPNSAVTIWRHEDNPIIWPEVLRAVSGMDPDTALQGDLDQAAFVMPDHAVERMTEFLTKRPELTLMQRRHVIASFLDVAGSGLHDADESVRAYAKDFESIRTVENITIIE